MLVDSHCHLDLFPESDIDSMMTRAAQNKVSLIHTISTSIDNIQTLLPYIEKYPNVYASVGVHPNYVTGTETVEQIIATSKLHNKIISIGETGLDYYRNTSNRKTQIESFIKHIEASRITKLPIVIHSRNADQDMIKILSEEMKKGMFKAVLHSFSSSYELFLTALELDLYISFSGIVTFKNATLVQRIASEALDNRILFETDAPYLSPTPHRGKRNETAFVKYVADYVATLRKNPNIIQQSGVNFLNLFEKVSIKSNVTI